MSAMNGGIRRRLRRIGYRAARRLLLGGGLVVLGVVAALTYVRRVETVEVAATLLFIPVFVALVLWGARGGLIAGVLAAAIYTALRAPAIDAVGLERFLGLIVSRGVAFIAFGAIGGWAARALEASLLKLDLYDQVDDATGLFNARFFLQSTDLEMSRAKRYETVFSVATLDVPAASLEPLSARKRARALRDLGRSISTSIRTVDRAIHSADDGQHRLAVILPETGKEGAAIFTGRLADSVLAYLAERGASVTQEQIRGGVISYPEDENDLLRLRGEFDRVHRREHPETAEEDSGEQTAPST